jgi:hypothetical protein
VFGKKHLLVASAAVSFAITAFAADKTPTANRDADREAWMTLFNGRDLTGWSPKITRYPFGENFGNTYRVEDGMIKVRYDHYTQFAKRFGCALNYKTYYVEYKADSCKYATSPAS